jgi:hypothetical protein
LEADLSHPLIGRPYSSNHINPASRFSEPQLEISSFFRRDINQLSAAKLLAFLASFFSLLPGRLALSLCTYIHGKSFQDFLDLYVHLGTHVEPGIANDFEEFLD